MKINHLIRVVVSRDPAYPLYCINKVALELIHDFASRCFLLHQSHGLTDIVCCQVLGTLSPDAASSSILSIGGRLSSPCKGIGSGSGAHHASVHANYNCLVGLSVRLRDRNVFRDPAARIFCVTVHVVSASTVISQA